MKRTPSPALIISIVALFVALGGTSYAAVKLNGKDIKKGTVAGKALKKNTLTGVQIKESKLGKVPSAAKADTAGSASSAATLAGISPDSIVKGNAAVYSSNKAIPASKSDLLFTVPGLVRFGGICNGSNELAVVTAAEVSGVSMIVTIDRPATSPLTTGGDFNKDGGVALSSFPSQKFQFSIWRESDPSVSYQITGGSIQCKLGAVAIGHG
jgi:hypothetical protein